MIVFHHIETSLQQGVCTIFLSREKNRNALDGQMVGELLSCLESLAEDEACRVVILRGKGPVFCAGGDLNWMLDKNSRNQTGRPSDLLSHLFFELYHFPKPLISYVHGYAMGGALGLIACSDFVFAEEDAYMAFSEVRLGLIPSTISPYVVKRIGEFRARQLMLTGDRISAAEAERVGLADVVVPCHENDKAGIAEEMLQTLSRRLAGNAPLALQALKQLLPFVSRVPIDDELVSYTSDLLSKISQSHEASEGINAFLEKRKPRWTGGEKNRDHAAD